jgi:predicted AlkP superfamily pyrophosphatase or phosphodiesterase
VKIRLKQDYFMNLLSKDFVLPRYNGESLLNVIATIKKFWGLDTSIKPLSLKLTQNKLDSCSQLVFFLVDGLGMNIINKSNYDGFFKFLAMSKKISTITSIFPSSTVPALSTIHTGLPPRSHGLLEWYLYFSEINETITPFDCKIVSKNKENTDKNSQKAKKLLTNIKTIYQDLAEKNVESIIFYPQDYLNSYYSEMMMVGSKKNGYTDFGDLNKQLSTTINENKKRRYIFVYISSLDTLEHKYGPRSKEVKTHFEEIDDFFTNLSLKIDSDVVQKTGVIITADHGLIQTSPKKIIFLPKKNTNKNLTLLDGYSVLPSGNQRDLFLSIKNELINSFIEKFHLKKKLIVKLIDNNLLDTLFGKFPNHPMLRSRIGNLLILPLKNNLICYRYLDKHSFSSLGKHGGLSRDEMLIPLITGKLLDLVRS